MRYRFIQEHRATWPIEVQCRVLEVSRSGYYAWRCRPQSCAARRRGELTERLREIHHGMVCSMSRKANCWDNAPTESLVATIKKELVHQQHYATRDQARRSLFEYIEVFYNRQRRHSALAYQTPDAAHPSRNREEKSQTKEIRVSSWP